MSWGRGFTPAVHVLRVVTLAACLCVWHLVGVMAFVDMGGMEFHLLYAGRFQEEPGWMTSARIVWCGYAFIALLGLLAMRASSQGRAAAIGFVGPLALAAAGNALLTGGHWIDAAVSASVLGVVMAGLGTLTWNVAQPVGAVARGACIALPGVLSLVKMATHPRTPPQFVLQFQLMTVLLPLLTCFVSVALLVHLASERRRTSA